MQTSQKVGVGITLTQKLLTQLAARKAKHWKGLSAYITKLYSKKNWSQYVLVNAFLHPVLDVLPENTIDPERSKNCQLLQNPTTYQTSLGFLQVSTLNASSTTGRYLVFFPAFANNPMKADNGTFFRSLELPVISEDKILVIHNPYFMVNKEHRAEFMRHLKRGNALEYWTAVSRAYLENLLDLEPNATVSFVGFSQGGFMTMRTIMTMAERFRHRVTKIMLVEPTGIHQFGKFELLRKFVAELRWLEAMWFLPRLSFAFLDNTFSIKSQFKNMYDSLKMVSISHEMRHNISHEFIDTLVNQFPNTTLDWISGRESGIVPYQSAHKFIRYLREVFGTNTVEDLQHFQKSYTFSVYPGVGHTVMENIDTFCKQMIARLQS